MILTYHHIGGKKGENWVSVKSFAQQMAELRDRKVVYLSEYDPNDKSHAVITFDDGAADIINALPILKKHGYVFEIFIVGDWFGTNGYIGAQDTPKIIAADGRLQWHTKTHRKLTELDLREIETELSVPEDIKKLDMNGFNALAYPFWVYDDKVLKAAEKNFSCARSGNGFAGGGGRFSLDSIKIKEHTRMKDKIVKYIELAVPTWPCNFRCHYCYVGHHCTNEERGRVDKFRYSPQDFAAALSIERVGGVAITNFCANGETLILPKNLEYIKAILGAGHFVTVVSNMVRTKAVNDLLELPKEWRERLFFKCSFHWLELKRLNLLETFTDNVNNAWKAGVSISVEITPSDELEPEIEEIKRYSMEHFGALPHITVSRDEIDGYKILTKHTFKEYKKIWGQFDSALFDFKMSIWHKKVHDFCYAGDWAYSINIADGNIFRCSSCGKVGNLFSSRKSLPRSPAASKCPFPHCYNGHVWIGLVGCVPEINSPTYEQMRDRLRTDKTHWLHPRMRSAFQSKAIGNNRRYAKIKERLFMYKERCLLAVILFLAALLFFIIFMADIL
ncbi:MAG: polysaccharide deacetylase family protein [Campylobacteraceae bacterium]|nr:polysaccharide deacetylase family protein [Campylobacteraceae bacterium]